MVNAHLKDQDDHGSDRTPKTSDEDVLATIMQYLLVQYNLHQGLKIFGKKEEAATSKELKQIHEMNALIPLNAEDLSEEVKKKAMASLIFLTEKRDGSIKARQCADGRKQREYILKEESVSPTVSNEAIFIMCTIESMERRSVAVVDLPRAFYTRMIRM